MHELSIAMSIVEICTEEARKAEATKVTRVELEVGSLSGIEVEALEFSWDVAVQNSLVEGSKLTIQKTQAIARCNECKKEFEVDNFYSICPFCENFGYDILKGKELQVKAITVE